eukprot:6803092-Pyramimonas_sp.AAC.1
MPCYALLGTARHCHALQPCAKPLPGPATVCKASLSPEALPSPAEHGQALAGRGKRCPALLGPAKYCQ